MKLLFAVIVAHGAAEAPPVHNLQALHTSSGSAIKPALDPVSDKKFMSQDYPDDLRPGLHHFRRYDWDHPYPIVQEDQQYDKDYVKDENNDNGEWNAQHKYDTLRSQIAKQKAKVDDYKRRIEIMGGDIDKIESEEVNIEGAAKNAEGKADSAKHDVDSAKSTEAGVQAKEDAAATGVKGEMGDMSRCEGELKKVEDQLKKLLKNAGTQIGDAEKAELELKKAAMEAELKQMSEGQLEAKLAEEKAEWLKAKKEYEKAVAATGDLQAQLDAAAEKLRKFRMKEDKDGGVYPVAFHSGASHFTPIAALVVGCFASLFV